MSIDILKSILYIYQLFAIIRQDNQSVFDAECYNFIMGNIVCQYINPHPLNPGRWNF
jgi:hypothetical protein